MQFIWNSRNFSLINFILQTSLLFILYVFATIVVICVLKRKKARATFFVLLVACIISYIFNLEYIFIAVNVGLCVTLFCLFMINISDVRKILANPLNRTSKKADYSVEKIIDKNELYRTIQAAVDSLSKTKTGAIITFEKDASLNEYSNNGVKIEAPVSVELLLTIFYPGTRLHDGAVVIRNNMIEYASVFYTPTTKFFAQKYGSRHRAAIGISETTDSLTVVVSEETGLVSIAVDGELSNVSVNDLSTVLMNRLG